MPDQKVSAKTEATTIGATDLVPVVQGGVTKKAQASTLAKAMQQDRRYYYEWWDDFEMPLGSAVGGPWDFAQAGTGAGFIQTTPGVVTDTRLGIAHLETGTVATNYIVMTRSYDLTVSYRNVYIVGTTDLVFETEVYVSAVPSAAQTYIAFVGFCDRTGTVVDGSVDAIFARIVYDSGSTSARWQLYCRKASANSLTLASTGPTAATWYHIKLVVNSTTVTMYVDGTQVAQEAVVANIPVAEMTLGQGIIKSVGATNILFLLDYVWVWKKWASAAKSQYLSVPFV